MISKKNSGLIYDIRTLNSVLFICFFILLFTSCSKKTKSVQEFEYVINVSESLSSKKEVVELSQYCSQINYIPLETNPKCILRNVMELELTDNYIYVSDGKHLYMFNQKGQFIREISKIGKGPEEHGARIRFILDRTNNQILIYDNISHPAKVLVMDAQNGTYKRTITLEVEVDKIALFTDNKLMFFTLGSSQKSKIFTTNQILLTDYNGNILDSIQDKSRLLQQNNLLGTISKHTLDGHVLYMGNFKNKMYKVTDTFEKVPYILFNYHNKVNCYDLRITPDKGEEYKDHIIIHGITEDQNNLFFTTQIGILPPYRIKENFVYSKQKHQLIHTQDLTNNLDGGMPYWPSFYTDNKFVMSKNARDIITFCKNNSGEHIQKVAKDLKIDSNPVLVIAQ
ncbi:6-bladed beta-propeller [Prolixibacteraceae bacterium]|nr:6-bladed beta-propeller [Prolixibacteraceae bacterium]